MAAKGQTKRLTKGNAACGIIKKQSSFDNSMMARLALMLFLQQEGQTIRMRQINESLRVTELLMQ